MGTFADWIPRQLPPPLAAPSASRSPLRFSQPPPLLASGEKHLPRRNPGEVETKEETPKRNAHTHVLPHLSVGKVAEHGEVGGGSPHSWGPASSFNA